MSNSTHNPWQDLFDEIESFFNDAIPSNLHDLPFKVMESVERVSGEISSFFKRAEKFVSAHPTECAFGGIFAVAGVGIGVFYRSEIAEGVRKLRGGKGRRLGQSGPGASAVLASMKSLWAGPTLKGTVKEGMLKEAVLVLSPSPAPSILLRLLETLARSDYVMIVAVPELHHADQLDQQLKPRANYKVLVYNPEEPSSLSVFLRSLGASFTLRYPVSTSTTHTKPTHVPGDPYAPYPEQLPQLVSVFNLYALQDDPSPAGNTLPALPSICKGAQSLVTFVNASGLLSGVPGRFGEQLVTQANEILARNVRVATGIKTARVVIGELDLTLKQSSPRRSGFGGIAPGILRYLPDVSRFFDKSTAWNDKVVLRALRGSGGTLGYRSLAQSLAVMMLPSWALDWLLRNTSLLGMMPSIAYPPSSHDEPLLQQGETNRRGRTERGGVNSNSVSGSSATISLPTQSQTGGYSDATTTTTTTTTQTRTTAPASMAGSSFMDAPAPMGESSGYVGSARHSDSSTSRSHSSDRESASRARGGDSSNEMEDSWVGLEKDDETA